MSILDQALRSRLIQSVGPENLIEDDAARLLASEDIWSKGACVVDAVITPRSSEALSLAVAAISATGRPLSIRGGGMSYTNGYVPNQPGALTIDLGRMDRVLHIDADNMTVTVEAGCTWKTLYETLKPLGLRAPFWGPLSGVSSTIGGGLSQLNALFGAGTYGTSSESVVGLKVVLADGRMLTTGARQPDAAGAFYRHYGPDLTGLFCGDCGVFGIKAEATLRLIRMPAAEAYGSYSFSNAQGVILALSEIARAGLACEAFSFDPGLARARMRRASLLSDISTLGSVIAKQTSLIEGVKQAAKIAMAGRSFLGEEDYSIHAVCEGRSAAAVEADLAAIGQIVARFGGVEVANTIPKVIRAQPFTPLNNVLGPGGERWVPVHGIVGHADAQHAFAAIEKLFTDHAEQLDTLGIEHGYMFTSMSTNSFLIEPVFLWPEARTAIHEATVEPHFLTKLKQFAPNEAATAMVSALRSQIIALFQNYGAAHYQIGRSYPYLASRDGAAQDLLAAIKRALDPNYACNPGGLGLQAPLAIPTRNLAQEKV
jgi:FAD/FMN-containing dehydrogenase